MEMEALLNELDINMFNLSKKDKFLFRSFLFVQIYRELNERFESRYEQYLKLIKCDLTKESVMLEANFLIHVIQDILLTNEYSLTGIANSIRMPEETIYDLVAGLNKNPSSDLWVKIIELHSTVRRDLYRDLINKIMSNQDKEK